MSYRFQCFLPVWTSPEDDPGLLCTMVSLGLWKRTGLKKHRNLKHCSGSGSARSEIIWLQGSRSGSQMINFGLGSFLSVYKLLNPDP